MDLKTYVRDISDFPSAGIIFKDFTPLLRSVKAMACAKQTLLNLIDNQPIDVVVGVESRGFFFAPLLAEALGAGFVPVRKPGKLPGETLQVSYALEYGTDRLEILKDAISTGDRVLIHDDVLATGGTAKATCELVKRLGGKIVQCNFLIHLKFLDGAAQLNAYPIASAIQYE